MIGVGSTVPAAFVGERTVASMIDVGGISLPYGPVAEVIPALGHPSPVDDELEAAAATSISDLYAVSKRIGPHLPKSNSGSYLNQQLSLVAGLINASVPTRVYEVNTASFDTHTGEVNDQNTLLSDVDTSIGNFMEIISKGSHSHDVTIMVYSEFGRRVASNASDGPDHGTASPVLVIGNGVKGGLYNEQPPLNHLDENGNLRVTTDFRSVYGGLLHDVLGTPVKDVIPGWNHALSVH